ncbi:hypothetical protein F511_30350 [Dorcoceras hygrometricum]|uniref:Uncharacterized protein n=1 Tax=Dorcoceras hygrometricum TaxID=472368 RepID=A0A2Z7B3T5_9LAMI|nr:hypothetical protein F511_30350 [Dorcoceras hygrometricum]
MASSLISNTNQVHFASVLAMENVEMVAMFEALVASGLNGFLGCMSDIFEAALIEFYQNASVRDGKVVSTVQGKLVEISEEVFARTFQLPVEGLIDINEDMVTPETRQTRGYTVHIFILLKNIPNLELGDSEEFPPLKILTAKTIGRYIAINNKIVVENVEGLAGKSRVKKTPVKRAVSKKRSAVAVDEQVVKKKRTLKGKAAPSKAKLELVSVALDAEPIQTIDPTSADDVDTIRAVSKKRSAVAVDEQVVKKKRTLKGKAAPSKAKLELVSVALDAEPIQTIDPTSADDVDTIIEQVVAETAQMDTDVEGTNVSGPDVEVQAGQRTDAVEHWFNASHEEFVAREAARMIESGSDTDDEIIADKVTGTDVGIHMETGPDAYFVEEPSEGTELIQGTEIVDVVPTSDEKKTDDESLSLEEILSTIPGGCSLPSSIGEVTKIQLGKSITIRRVNEGDWYKTSLPKIPAAAKGKAPLQERDPIKGNPAKEIFSLIFANIEVLVQLREKVIDEVEQFFNSFSFKKMAALKIEDIYEKEEQVLTLGETDSTEFLFRGIDSDLVIYRTTLVRTFQVVTICRVDKSESTRSVLGKCVYLVALVMSLFDIQDVCITIGSIATLDLPMVVDLIGIYGLKGPYCTLTTTNWFLQALSMIPRGSWGDVARRSYHDPMGKSGIVIPEPQWLWAHG